METPQNKNPDDCGAVSVQDLQLELVGEGEGLPSDATVTDLLQFKQGIKRNFV